MTNFYGHNQAVDQGVTKWSPKIWKFLKNIKILKKIKNSLKSENFQKIRKFSESLKIFRKAEMLPKINFFLLKKSENFQKISNFPPFFIEPFSYVSAFLCSRKWSSIIIEKLPQQYLIFQTYRWECCSFMFSNFIDKFFQMHYHHMIISTMLQLKRKWDDGAGDDDDDDDDDDGDDDDGVYRQLVSLKLTTSSSNLQLHR